MKQPTIPLLHFSGQFFFHLNARGLLKLDFYLQGFDRGFRFARLHKFFSHPSHEFIHYFILEANRRLPFSTPFIVPLLRDA